MGRLVVALMAVACVLAGWRNLPPIPDASAVAAGFIFAALLVGAYLLGKRTARASAMAVAMARAEAVATSRASSQSSAVAGAQVLIQLDPATGARHAALEQHGQPEWIGEPKPLAVEDAVDTAMEDVVGEVIDASEGYVS